MVATSFYALSVAAIGMLSFLFKTYSTRNKIIGGSLIVVWIIYLNLLAKTEVLKNFEFPPRIPLLVVIPAILIILFITNRKSLKQALESTPTYLPIALQSFRILVELLIYATFLNGIFPQRATFEGLNYDILVGISALFISAGVYKGIINKRGILIWNVVSICILALTVYSFISTYYFTDFVSTGGGYQFVEFPYLLLASILLPVAIFLHVFSIKQAIDKDIRS